MTMRCPEMDELAGVTRRPETDPLRVHADGCPRCRAQLALYRRFLEPGVAPEGADLGDARHRMRGALEGAGAIHPASPRPGRGNSAFLRARDLFLRPAWKPALGVAGLAAVLLLAWRGVGDLVPGGARDPVLRDRVTTPGTAPVLAEPRRNADGSVTFRWSLSAGADAYEVILFGTDLEEKTRFAVGADLSFTLDPARAALLGTAPFCAVSALKGGDEIGRSAPVAVGAR
jgi:hypothetical protein